MSQENVDPHEPLEHVRVGAAVEPPRASGELSLVVCPGASGPLTLEHRGDEGIPMGPTQDEPSLDQASVDGRSRSLADLRQARDAPAGHQRSSSVDDGSADLAAGLAEIGLTPKAAWYSGGGALGRRRVADNRALRDRLGAVSARRLLSRLHSDRDRSAFAG